MPGAVCCPPTCDICSQKDTNSKPAEDSTAFNQQVDTWHAQGPVGTNPIRKLYIWKFHASLWKNKWPIDINRRKHLTGDQRQEGNNDALRQPSLNKKWMGKIEKLKENGFQKGQCFSLFVFFVTCSWPWAWSLCPFCLQALHPRPSALRRLPHSCPCDRNLGPIWSFKENFPSKTKITTFDDLDS